MLNREFSGAESGRPISLVEIHVDSEMSNLIGRLDSRQWRRLPNLLVKIGYTQNTTVHNQFFFLRL